jgi:glutamate racemase
MNQQPIGVFDSGIGGLTVVRELMHLLPHEDIVYFGDTARVPYGTKSEKVIRNFAVEDTLFLRKQGVKMVVVACNTVSAVALGLLEEKFALPLVGVVKPGAAEAARRTRNKKVGVIGTPRTVSSGIYEREIRTLDHTVQVFSKACPLFVPIVEEGWEEKEATLLVAREYMEVIKAMGVDTLVLGCTHYPLLSNALTQVMGRGVQLVNSGAAAATAVQTLLTENAMGNSQACAGALKVFISDVPYHFQLLAERLLGREVKDITRVDLEAIDLGGYE